MPKEQTSYSFGAIVWSNLPYFFFSFGRLVLVRLAYGKYCISSFFSFVFYYSATGEIYLLDRECVIGIEEGYLHILKEVSFSLENLPLFDTCPNID